jgi:parallel beta-helix repeat protein
VIRGAGVDQTLIRLDTTHSAYRVIVAVDRSEPPLIGLTISDVSLIGGHGGISFAGNGLHVERCTIRNGRFGISLFDSDDSTIKDSEFRDIEHTSVIAYGSLSRNLLVENCVFHGETGIHVQSTSNAVVRDCEMFGMKLGVQFELWTSGEVVRLHATGQPGFAWGVGVGVTSVSHMTMTDCVIDFSMTATGAASVGNHATLSGQGNVFRGGLLPRVNSDVATLALSGANSVENFHGNEIYRASEYCVHATYSSGDMMQPPIHLDMTNNYWGTDDADLIAEWIYDHHDRPHSPNYRAIVDYIPFASGPVPVLQRTLSEVKGMFRD